MIIGNAHNIKKQRAFRGICKSQSFPGFRECLTGKPGTENIMNRYAFSLNFRYVTIGPDAVIRLVCLPAVSIDITCIYTLAPPSPDIA